MKPSQVEQIRLLSKCWMDEYETRWVSFFKFAPEMSLCKAMYLRHLWNRYQPQIRHLMKTERKAMR